MISVDRRSAPLHAFEVRRVLHVGRTVVPGVSHAALDRDLAPVGIALEYVGVFLGENLLGDVLGGRTRRFPCSSGQMSFRKTFLPFLSVPSGSLAISTCIEPASA